MDKRFRYCEKNVRDIPSCGGLVRVWDASGDLARRSIAEAYEDLFRAGFVHPYVALMPDHHPGEGAMVGSVIPTRDVLLPSVIGGDLGCGVSAIKLPVPGAAIKPVLPALRDALKASIPTGSSHNPTVTERVRNSPIWGRNMASEPMPSRLARKMMHQFASLGGGNHFLEIQEDDEGAAWIMIHCGSRYLGVLVRNLYIEKGKHDGEVDPRKFARLPYFPAGSALANAYLADLGFSVDFARENRREIMMRAIEVVAHFMAEVKAVGIEQLAGGIMDIAHNYIAKEDHFGELLFIHRKGAIRASDGETVLIPGSMGTCSYVADGCGNDFAFCSASHGAGRAMSRHAALRTISDQVFEQSMGDVLYDQDMRLKDESPEAYKNIRMVMRGQRDLVRIRIELKPLLSIKGRD